MTRLRRFAANLARVVRAPETLAVTGGLLLSTGAALAWPPAGLMTAGVLLLAVFVVVAAFGSEAG